MVPKYSYQMLSGTIPDKVTPDIDFKNETAVIKVLL